jgi:hypothetical protein
MKIAGACAESKTLASRLFHSRWCIEGAASKASVAPAALFKFEGDQIVDFDLL